MCARQFQAAAASCLSENPVDAINQIISDLQRRLSDQTPDITFVFVSYQLSENLHEIADLLDAQLHSQVVLGCTGESIIGNDQEIENEPAIVVWSAVMPDAELKPFHLNFHREGDSIVCEELPECSETDFPRTIFLLGEPFSCAADAAIESFAELLPGSPIFGGMASGGNTPGKNRLILNGDVIDSGAVGVVVTGGPTIRPIISQGCEPIGTTMLVTKAEDNIIYELGRQPALDMVRDQLLQCTEEQQQLAGNGLHLGIAMSEYRDSFRQGDFLVANVLGFDQERSLMAITRSVRIGQTVQLHVRNASTAHWELLKLIETDREHAQSTHAALIFSCNGRGSRLFESPHHDAASLRSVYGEIPAAGFFAQGEFGPVAGKNYIHGFTASIALFSE